MLSAHTPAPDFTLPDQDGVMHTLSDYKGRWGALYFYPKDQTPGCTTEACSFRDSFADYKKSNVWILGVSTDTSASHKKFHESEHLPFPLLADETKNVATLYDVLETKGILALSISFARRVSYLIDPLGIIQKVYANMDISHHAKEILTDIKTLSRQR